MILKALLVGSSPNEFSSTSLQDLDILFPDLVYDYYAAAWDGPQGRLEVFVTMITMTMMVTMVTMVMLVMMVMMVMLVTMMMLRMLLW